MNNNDTQNPEVKIFRQKHPWSARYGPTSLLHLGFHTRSCYSHIKLPDRLARWNGNEMDIPKQSKFGRISAYTQYSVHLDNINVEDRRVEYDDREYDLDDFTFTYRIDHDSYFLNTKSYVALKPEYKDRTKRVILI